MLTDLTFIEQLTRGNELRRKKYIEIYCLQAEQSLNGMEDALKHNDAIRLQQLIHFMKPQYETIGMKEARDMAAQIEVLLKDAAQIALVQALLDVLIGQTRESIMELKPILN